ncbi:TonB-dependent receptor plug domain-containing protein [Microbacterium algeriense]|uniref:TonB-dependent receptor plug domain-containing protein n=1 Tax=Microbacterium algeriense TaxID=2615184 RepID=UPI0022DFAB8D|nr:TonB-dependent receptor plug domain-containing protein [Microbacterium algeriense]
MDGEWFDAVPPGSTYEAEFESLVQQHSASLFPGFLSARFDPLFRTPLGDVKPDLVLVDKEYRSWFIVEVELSTHPVTRHVKPQMEKITAARSTAAHADWLADRSAQWDRSRLRRLMLDAPHGTVLLANAPTPHWDDALRTLPGVIRGVVEVYRSNHNRTILRVNGSQPQAPGATVSGLTPGDGYFSNAYKIDLPSSLPMDLEHIDVLSGGEPVRYRVKQIGGDRYLFPTPSSNLPNRAVRLMVDDAGVHRIEE